MSLRNITVQKEHIKMPDQQKVQQTYKSVGVGKLYIYIKKITSPVYTNIYFYSIPMISLIQNTALFFHIIHNAPIKQQYRNLNHTIQKILIFATLKGRKIQAVSSYHN